LIHSLRDLGYDLPTAVADLVDNSVAAKATQVNIDMRFGGDASWVRVADDGLGMSPARMLEAMRFGTRRDYADDDLGRFGLGLKAASLSQCRCLTVATRSTSRGRIRIAQWDLDHVDHTDRWEILHPRAGDVPLAVEPLHDRRGTVILWDDLDRVFRYRLPDGRRARNDFERIMSDVAQHLSMVFHRFLSSESPRGLPLMVVVNGVRLEPWDPFARSEPETMRLPVQTLRFVHNHRPFVVEVQPFVLPQEARFSSPAAHRSAAGPRLWNRQQGFYLYRNGRMIQSGGWSRLRTQDEHSKLARVSIDLPAGADELFELNVSKTQARIPEPLRAELSAIASNVTRLAQHVYRTPVGATLATTSAGKSDDVRIRAISGLVEMVVSATEAVINGELPPAQARRVASRLREMQSRFVDELEAEVARELNGGAAADPSAARTPVATGLGRPTGVLHEQGSAIAEALSPRP
jgi:signal transduction histidine kinase